MGNEYSSLISAYKNSSKEAKNPVQKKKQNYFSAKDLDRLDEFIMTNPNETPQSYDAYDEMEKIKNGTAMKEIKNSKLPKAILHEMTTNPIDTSVFDVNNDFDEKLNSMLGLEKSKNILNKLEENNKKKPETVVLNEKITPPTKDDYVGDFDVLREMISDILDEKLKSLNESIQNRGGGVQLSMLQQKGDNGFMFIDSDNNIYECVLKKVGKVKVKH